MNPSFPHAIRRVASFLLVALLTLGTAHDRAAAQGGSADIFGGVVNTIVPQQKTYGANADRISVAGVTAAIDIRDDVATTALTARVVGGAGAASPTTFQILLPVPVDAELVEAPKSGVESDPNMVLLNIAGEEAVTTYLAGARQFKASEILEFAGTRMILAGPFAVREGESREVTITYRQRVTPHGNRIDYTLPRSASFSYGTTPWAITATVNSSQSIAALYSPSHPLTVVRSGAAGAIVTVQEQSVKGARAARPASSIEGGKYLDPGDFRLSILRGAEVEASFMAYADPQAGQGCFLMLLGANAPERRDAPAIKREIIVVIDRSGSMQGEKIEQAKAAAKSVLQGLEDGEAFTIIDYSDSVTALSATPLIKNEMTLRLGLDYIDDIVADGGTNIHDAMVRAMATAPTPGMLPIVIFMTDGLPTVGIIAEDSIRRGVAAANVHGRRVFTLGIGVDVNAPLLDAMAKEARGAASFALPGERVDEVVAELFAKLKGPILSDITLRVEMLDGRDASHLVTDMLPATLSDLFEGDYLSLFGHYNGPHPVVFIVRGNYAGEMREYRFAFDPATDFVADATFLCRLWANRKIMENVDRISKDGEVPAHLRTPEDSIRMRRETEEIFDLSMRNGIITEYTSYLAADTVTTSRSVLLSDAGEKLKSGAQDKRSGLGAATQKLNANAKALKGGMANASNTYVDQDYKVVEIRSVQQIDDLSFFRRGDRWVESAVLDSARTESPDVVYIFGTDAYDAFVRELLARDRARVLALEGTILMRHEGRLVMVKGGGGAGLE